MKSPTLLESVEREMFDQAEARSQVPNNLYDIEVGKTKALYLRDVKDLLSCALKKQREAIVEMLPKKANEDKALSLEMAMGYNYCLRAIKHMLTNNDKQL